MMEECRKSSASDRAISGVEYHYDVDFALNKQISVLLT